MVQETISLQLNLIKQHLQFKNSKDVKINLGDIPKEQIF